MSKKNHENKDIISWTEDGDAFCIYSPSRLSKEILMKYFRHSNFASFIRQLNLYGFKKRQTTDKGTCFWHKYFKRGQVKLLSFIKRKKFLIERKADKTGKDYKDIFSMKESIDELKTRNSELEEYANMLIIQNSKILEDNKFIVLQMMNYKYIKKKPIRRESSETDVFYS